MILTLILNNCLNNLILYEFSIIRYRRRRDDRHGRSEDGHIASFARRARADGARSGGHLQQDPRRSRRRLRRTPDAHGIQSRGRQGTGFHDHFPHQNINHSFPC